MGVASYFLSAGAGAWQVRRGRAPSRWYLYSRVASLFFVVIGLGAMVVKPLVSARVAGARSGCLRNAKDLALVVIMYGADYDDRLPPGSVWATATEKHLPRGTPKNPQCEEGDAEAPYDYGLNKHLAGKSFIDVDEPAITVIVFEMQSQTPNPVGDQESLSARPSPGGWSIAFADGHSRYTNSYSLGKVLWKNAVKQSP